KLRGMFAFAVWNRSRRTLFLARDRLGIKPLYYGQTPHGFVFGSELKAVLQSPWVPREVDRRGGAAYLQVRHVPEALTVVERVARLATGHTLPETSRRGGAAG